MKNGFKICQKRTNNCNLNKRHKLDEKIHVNAKENSKSDRHIILFESLFTKSRQE